MTSGGTSGNRESAVTGSSPVGCLTGVGPMRAEALGQAGLACVEDLLFHLPLRYEDKRAALPLGPPDLEEKQLYLLKILTVSQGRTGTGGRLHRLQARAEDQSGTAVTLSWINQRFRSGALAAGCWYCVYGRLVSGGSRSVSAPSGWQIENPDLDPADDPAQPLDTGPHLGRIIPVYRRIGSVGSRVIRTAMFGLFQQPLIGFDGTASAVLMNYGFPGREALFRGIHCPPDSADMRLLLGGRSIWHRGLAFEELYLQQRALAEKRRRRLASRKKAAPPDTCSVSVREQLTAGLEELAGFSLTNGQQQAIEEIINDLHKPYPMRRLLQGEVGCGKTVVAYAALFHAANAGHQVALMVPTEALAWQHFQRLVRLLDAADKDHPLRRLAGRTILVSGDTNPTQRRHREKQLGRPGSLIAIGTHALLSTSVVFRDLSLAVVDEQQRFGVGQREKLRSKGANPDLLVISATPIPRTMSLRLCGDMDLSRISEVPRGRRTVETFCLEPPQAARAMELLEGELDAGRQGFIVCPRVKSHGGVEKRAAETVYQKIRTGRLSKYNTDLLHGGMSLEESRSAMDRFQQGQTRLLVTTTVVEVGLDVERATVMIVLEPERFGLSQLHQLRGRIGRGKWPGLFILLRSMDDTKGEALQRLAVLTSSADGFFIAEEDLRLRGSGELTGLRQAGGPGFRGSAGEDDGRLLRLAREAAFDLHSAG